MNTVVYQKEKSQAKVILNTASNHLHFFTPKSKAGVLSCEMYMHKVFLRTILIS